MKSLVTSLILLLACANAQAQHELLTSYDWESAPKAPEEIPEGVTDILLKRNVLSHYSEEGDNIYHYQLFHMQRYLHDAAAVEDGKTITVGTGHIFEVIEIKARSIAPDGRITVLGEDAFKKSEDDRNTASGIYFAFEGLQPGSIVEYIMLSSQRADLRGDMNRMQFSIPVQEARFELIVPEDWVMAFKGYNDTPIPQVDSSHAGVLRHHLHLTDLPAVENEESADVSKYCKYIVFKLDAIPTRNVRDVGGYIGATKIYHGALYPELDKKTTKELESLLKKIGVRSSDDEADRIRKIDRYLHDNFRMAEAGGQELADLSSILRSSTCNDFGMQRLYCNVLRTAGIEHQVVVTSDNSATPFDPQFEAHNFLDEVMLYFPGPDKFIDPTDFTLGLGYISPEFMNTHGLFIKNIDMGGVFTGAGSIKPIPALPAEATRHDMVINVELNNDATEATIDLETGLTGYYARVIQNFYELMEKEQQQELLQAHLGHFTEGALEQKIEVENGEAKWFGVEPFTMKGRVVSPKFTNAAGNEVLLRAGELIGPQMEMYVDKERTLPLDGSFNRYYDRKITITLPKGWECADLSPLEIHKTLEMDGKIQGEFRSTATQKDGVISVEVIEYYRSIHIPVEHFNGYRSVINAAADFNKRALVLKPAKG